MLKSRLLFAVVFLSLLMLGFGVQFSSAVRMDCWVRVIPEQPTELDEVKVAVNFLFYTDPPNVIDFGTLHRDGNTFSVDVIIWVPAKEKVRPSIHNDSFTYNLGRLEAGEYTFKVYVQTIHGSNGYWLEREVRFTVSSSDDEAIHAAELPNISYMLVLLALTSVATILLKVSKRKR